MRTSHTIGRTMLHAVMVWASMALCSFAGCGTALSAAARVGEQAEGKGSWYGKEHHGTLTASGGRFNMYEFTAAHLHLPFGTLVRVENLRNGKKVDVRINDRGPYVRGRIIDVSYAAAERLGMLKSGVVMIRMTVLELPPPKAKRPVAKRAPGKKMSQPLARAANL